LTEPQLWAEARQGASVRVMERASARLVAKTAKGPVVVKLFLRVTVASPCSLRGKLFGRDGTQPVMAQLIESGKLTLDDVQQAEKTLRAVLVGPASARRGRASLAWTR
jgi:hypothetical protein